MCIEDEEKSFIYRWVYCPCSFDVVFVIFESSYISSFSSRLEYHALRNLSYHHDWPFKIFDILFRWR